MLSCIAQCQKIVCHYNKSLDSLGDYVEKLCTLLTIKRNLFQVTRIILQFFQKCV